MNTCRLPNRPIYFLGGGTCCGKSTLAGLLVKKYSLRYFKLDDYLIKFTRQMAKDGNPLAAQMLALSPDETWMRSPRQQCREEILLYKAMLPYALNALHQFAPGHGVIAEGAGFMPHLMAGLCVPASQYLCVVPSRAFQIKHFRRRFITRMALIGVRNKTAGFLNWMERDALFSQQMRRLAEQAGYATLLVDGSHSINYSLAYAENVFGLATKNR